MKNSYQVRDFVSSQIFKSYAEYDMVIAFCSRQKVYITTAPPQLSPEGTDSFQFVKWFDEGIGAGDIVSMEGKTYVAGRCSASDCHIVARISEEDVTIEDFHIKAGEAVRIEGEERRRLLGLMAKSGFQYDRNTNSVVEKFIPQINDRIKFWNDEREGVGAVRSIDIETGDIELYCYFIYETSETAYSMHEKGICNLYSDVIQEASRSQQKRLSRELAKFGKEWNEKLHMIHPTDYKLPVGKRYYMLNDKLDVVSYLEKDNYTSMCRRNKGNYFHSHDEALEMAGRIADMLKDYMAK